MMMKEDCGSCYVARAFAARCLCGNDYSRENAARVELVSGATAYRYPNGWVVFVASAADEIEISISPLEMKALTQ